MVNNYVNEVLDEKIININQKNNVYECGRIIKVFCI